MNSHQIKQGRILWITLVSNLSFGGLHELIVPFLDIENRESHLDDIQNNNSQTNMDTVERNIKQLYYHSSQMYSEDS